MAATRTPILIAGAGPTGLMLALQLARLGIAFRIVDGKSGPTRESRAVGVQARTLEQYEAIGVAADAVAQGRRTEAVNLYVGARHVQRIPLAELGKGLSPFPYLLILEQSRNEALLHDALRAAGREVEWHTTLADFRDTGDHVIATLRRADGSEETLHADWLAGCDGAKSAVREHLGLPFAGGTYESVFYVVDTRVDGELMREELMVCFSERTFVLFFPMAGERRYRVIGVLPPDHRRDEPDLGFEDIEATVRAQMGFDVRFSDTAWFSAYRVHHRCVERFRVGRVLLAGDAAHVHSPVGAQGMNTGLQDACNLGWKLALVARGQAGEALLDTYHDERWPFAQRLLHTTDQAFRFAVGDAPVVRWLRLHVFPALAARVMQWRPVRERIFRTVSQIGIDYRGSRLAHATPSAASLAVRAGDRLPYADVDAPLAPRRCSVYSWLAAPGLHLLLLSRGDSAALQACAKRWRATLDGACPDTFTVHAVSHEAASAALFDAVGVRDRALLLMRPDQYLAYVDVDLDAPGLLAWLREGLSLAAPAPITADHVARDSL